MQDSEVTTCHPNIADRVRCLGFAKRMVFKGYENLTEQRRRKLWEDAEDFLMTVLESGCRDWEDTKGTEGYACDYFHERFEEHEYPSRRWERKIDDGIYPTYYAMLSAICRSALDILDGFAGGVWGWTVGDIRRMYDGQLPPWFPTDGWAFVADGPVERPLQDDDRITL